MIRQIFSTVGAVALCTAAVLPKQALAESEQGVVVELYTSQGCSSCPPADALMAKISTMPGVIGLALHVDYWDYIGWKDTFGQAQFTERQKAYAHTAGEKMIYTPQMIVAGLARVAGNQPAEVAEAVAAVKPSPVQLTLARQDSNLVINASGALGSLGEVSVQLVHYTDQALVDIGRGENAGLTVTYHNIVTAWQTVGAWTGAEPLHLVTPAGDGPVVVILQSGPGLGQVIAAARLK